MGYVLPRNIFINLQEFFGKEKAELIASELEHSIDEQIVITNKNLKVS